MRTRKAFLLPCLFLIALLPATAQIIHLEGYNQKLIAPNLLNGDWTARWIAAPGENTAEYGVYHFRKTITLGSVPGQYVIHVSADNRYKLFVNGQMVSLGPARCDTKNWNFETINIAPYLREGGNTLAAVVWNASQYAPVAQMSTGKAMFIVQGNTEAEAEATTNNSWKVVRDKAYTPHTERNLRGYYAAGACDRVDGSLYPWGWEQNGYDDRAWPQAQALGAGYAKGGRDKYTPPLVPSPIPQMELTPQRLKEVRQAEGIGSVPKDFLKKPVKLTIPARSEVRLLLDHGVLTAGYPTLTYSGGQGATIDMGYAEALYEQGENGRPTGSKGNRNEVEGKVFLGYRDRIVADGGSDRAFTPLWWRTWRYIELKVTTADQPIEINDLNAIYQGYPFELASAFHAPGHELYDKLLEVGWRTARLCAHETYMDCPYYEQLMYFGDTRIQTMLTMYNTHDPYMVRNALELGRQSVFNEGITLSRYPDNLGQVIPSYALSWIGMCYDYWMYRGDETYLRSLLPTARGILAWYEAFLQDNGSLDKIPYWYFCDWSEGFSGGTIPRDEHGNSAMQDLNYILALEEAAKMERQFGLPAMADHYTAVANRMRQGFNGKYWDSARQLYADTHSHSNYSQHSNILAILAGVVTGDEAKALCRRILTDKSLNQATIYFSYYLYMAMEKAGLGDELLDNIEVFTNVLDLGLTTCMESPEPSRSDCHAWSASMNIEFLRTVLGVHSAAPGFGKVLVSPSLGKLKEASGKIPCPQGDIEVSYKKKGNTLTAEITLPQNLSGTFAHNGKEYSLNPGTQRIVVE